MLPNTYCPIPRVGFRLNNTYACVLSQFRFILIVQPARSATPVDIYDHHKYISAVVRLRFLTCKYEILHELAVDDTRK